MTKKLYVRTYAAYNNDRKVHGYVLLYRGKRFVRLRYPLSIYYFIEDTMNWYKNDFIKFIKLLKYNITHFIVIDKRHSPLNQFGFLYLGRIRINISIKGWKILRKIFPEKCGLCNNNLILKDRTLMHGRIKDTPVCIICHEVLKNNQ